MIGAGPGKSGGYSMTEHWYHLVHGKQYGPFSFKGLRERIHMGVLHPDDEVLRDGAKDWVDASTVPGLFATESVSAAHVDVVTSPKPSDPVLAPIPPWLIPTVCLFLGIGLGMGLMALLMSMSGSR